MDHIVSLNEVTKTYRQGESEVVALNKASLKIRKGDFMSLSGPSGSGKSTLLNLVGGLDRPTNGEIAVAGLRTDTMNRGELANLRLRHIGFIFQAYNLIPVLSAVENVEFVMRLQGVPGKQRQERAAAILASVGLQGMENRRPAELSGGQQQRVAVARAIVSNPDLVLADEPTANLDSKSALKLLELMRDMNEKRGVTFVFSTHDPRVMECAKRRVELKDGQIVSDGMQWAA